MNKQKVGKFVFLRFNTKRDSRNLLINWKESLQWRFHISYAMKQDFIVQQIAIKGNLWQNGTPN